jgi:hypothetical protein
VTVEQLLTVPEFADLVRQHAKTVYARIARHEQPGVVRVGRSVRIDVAVALKSQCAETHGHTRS